MRNTVKEEQLLKSIRQSYEIIHINTTSHDIEKIVEGLQILEQPDYIYQDCYVEHFEVTAYKRTANKTGKLSSIHLAHENQMGKRIDDAQNVFGTVHYHTPPNRTNTRYLKENIKELIGEKTLKQREYNIKCPEVKNRHLLIELKSRCEIILGMDGRYLDGSETEEERKSGPTEFFEVYRDEQLMNTLKAEYSNNWDLLIFIQEYRNLETHVFYLYCFDLKSDIEPENMKKYPYKLSQIVLEGMGVLSTDCGNNVTNVRYDIKSGDSVKRNHLWEYEGEYILVDRAIKIRKSKHDSIYISMDGGLQFETSQIAFAITPDAEPKVVSRYISLLLKPEVTVFCEGVEIKLVKKTPTNTYCMQYGKYLTYRIDEKRNFTFEVNRNKN